MKTLALFLFSTAAFASDFTVYRSISGCKYFVVEQGYDFVLVDKWNCSRPYRGDTGSGELKSYGFKDVILNGTACRIYVDNYALTRSSALEKLADRCGE